jgi:hypothetical protein
MKNYPLDLNENVKNYTLKSSNSQAPQPPTGFFVSFDVSLLGHRRMNFLLWSEFRGAVTISLNQWWNGPSCCS